MLPSQLMDFLRVIDKYTKNLPQLNVLTIVLTEQGNLRRKEGQIWGKLSICQVFSNKMENFVLDKSNKCSWLCE